MNNFDIVKLLWTIYINKGEFEKAQNVLDWKSGKELKEEMTWVDIDDLIPDDFIIPEWTMNQWNYNRLNEVWDRETEQSMEIIFNNELFSIKWHYLDSEINVEMLYKNVLISEYQKQIDLFLSYIDKINKDVND